MNDMEKYLSELLIILRTAQHNFKSKGKTILMVKNGNFNNENKRPNKQDGKGKFKEVI